MLWGSYAIVGALLLIIPIVLTIDDVITTRTRGGVVEMWRAWLREDPVASGVFLSWLVASVIGGGLLLFTAL